MEIRKVYKTSKGIYLTKEQAEKNRVKIPHSDHLLCYKEREVVVEVWAIFDNHNEKIFALTPIDVKF